MRFCAGAGFPRISYGVNPGYNARMTASRTITLAFTGASGLPYGLRLLECLIPAQSRIYLVYSPAAQMDARQELVLLQPSQPHAAAAILATRSHTEPGLLT